MSEEMRKSSLPESIQTAENKTHLEDDELKESTETKENICTQETQQEKEITDEAFKDDTCASDAKFCKIPRMENEKTEKKIGDKSEEDKTSTHDPSIRTVKLINMLQKTGELDEKSIFEYLTNIPDDELLKGLEETEQINAYLLKENEVYEFILKEDETVQNSLDNLEVDENQSTEESFVLSYPAKCYFATKKLEHTEKELELKKAGYAHELQNLNFELESLNTSLKDLNESKEKFDKNVRIGGRHPVTKKIILQKVAKFFDDSIRTKMALTNRYKIQIQSDIMERNKILSQIKAQEKRLASLDMTEFQETQFEHKKSCRQLAMYKEQLGKFKAKFSPILQNIAEMKKALEKEQNEMEQMKNAVSKLEHLKEVMWAEKARNDQKVLELKAAMRKIKLDPRRHNLPEVIDYAAVKRENASLKKNINKWKKKVELTQQEKFLYLNALSKKSI